MCQVFRICAFCVRVVQLCILLRTNMSTLEADNLLLCLVNLLLIYLCALFLQCSRLVNFKVTPVNLSLIRIQIYRSKSLSNGGQSQCNPSQNQVTSKKFQNIEIISAQEVPTAVAHSFVDLSLGHLRSDHLVAQAGNIQKESSHGLLGCLLRDILQPSQENAQNGPS